MSLTNVLFLAEELRVGGAETYFYKIENKIDLKKINFYTAAVNGRCFDKLNNKHMYFEYEKGLFSKIKTIKKIVISKNINVIHANSLRLAIISSIVKKLYKKDLKIVYTKHNLTILEKIHTKLFSAFVNKNVDIVLAVCNKDRDNMISIGVSEEKVKVIPNSIDLKHFKFNSKYLRDAGKDFKVGMLSRLSKEKNHEFFLDIAEKADFRALIGGDGPLREEINNRIEKSNLKKKVKMLGNIENSYEFLSSVDVMLLVSTREIFPMTLLEAMAVGTIVISVDIGGIRDCVINDKTGYVIDDYQSEKFITKISDILSDYDKNKELISAARELVENSFNLDITIDELQRLYGEVGL
ncbi:glycosyltransferase involved in cell wall biosynthesis [Clostridium acetobutylicum]|uniref:Glycosyltransferase n=2 Tax=Clostridium acetobutylicum TaxID=1488 RepID=Q97EQ6_CLOAB|nr:MULTISPECIES: glycosyltransferase family 4 protein [Clostridium]AAK80992.1 Glycosyltransferase [Clostridium acetobutylicum ATCC 824]ADZ22095.1 Glycosyltransferase [Clostridium acetobutylicum EA 2018]AEI32669.1 glycosyltransferase [Clostridium acetobutylicum DSM 1731]AWV78597.1 glycosyltransferase family 1 protein [Clostridium acetobutylicum]MBC2393457.1 glycosyltransferase family 4 protein [Clostridium acetobutylicum]